MGNRTEDAEITKWYGLNTKTSQASTPIGFSNNLRNIDLSIPGVARTRGGSVQHTASQMGFDAVRQHDFYRPADATHYHLVQGGTKVCKISAAGAKTDLITGLTADEIADFVNFKNECFISNGEDEGKVTDGTTSRKWGITAPGSVASLASGAAGVPNGTYSYYVTFRNSTTGHESNPHTTAAEITVSSSKIELTSIPVSADSQVDERRVYRTTTGGAIFFLLATIADNTTTVFSDNNADSALLTSEVPLDNDVPNEFLIMEEWDGRIWGAQKNSTSLEFSNTEFKTPSGSGVPQESFSQDNRIEMFLEIRGIKKSPNFDEIWIHTNKGTYAIVKTENPDDPYVPVIRNADQSTVSHYSIINIYNQQWFVNSNAKIVSMVSSGFIRYESELIEPNMTGSRGETGANYTRLNEIQAVHYQRETKNQYRFIMAESGETFGSVMYASNYLLSTPPDEKGKTYPVWEKHTIEAKSLAIVKDSNDQDVLYTSSDGEHIIQQDTGTNDEDVAIDWLFAVGWARTALTPNLTNLFRWVKAYFDPLGDYTFSMQIDFDFGSKGGEIYPVTMVQSGDQLDIDFILDVSLLAATGLLPRTIDVKGGYNYVELTFFGNALDQIMEMHNLVILAHEQKGLRRD